MDQPFTDPQQPNSAPFPPALTPVRGEHAALNLPFVANIDGRQYRGTGLSLVMAEISGLMDPGLEGAQRLVRLVFNFNGFAVTLDVMARIERIDRAQGHATVVFSEPAGKHLPQLRHMLNAYIAGDLVALGEVIGVGAILPTPIKAAKAATARGFGLRRFLGGTALLAATLVLVGVVGITAYNRAFTVPLLAPGRVDFDGLTLASVATGQIDYINPQAAPGQVAFSVRSVSGDLLSIAMPCDCVVQLLGPGLGATVQAGEPLMALAAPDAAMVITTQVPAATILDLAFADHVVLRFQDGSQINATVDPQSLRSAASARDMALVPVRLIPQSPLAATRTGALAALTIIKPIPAVLKPIVAAFDRIGG